MLVFLDEAGDLGFKFSKGSSHFLIITLVLFDNEEEAKSCDLRIGLLRRELRLPEKFEFHFNQNSPEIRKDFLRAVAPYKLSYFAVVIDKNKFRMPEPASAKAFYRHACSLVFEIAKKRLNEAIVTIDGKGGRHYKRDLQRDLKKKINEPKANVRYIATIKIQDSAANNLIQLADMVCGAVNRSFSGKPDAHEYRQIITHREAAVEMVPK